MVSVLRCILTNTSNAPLRDRPCFRWTTFISLWGTLGPQPPTVEKTSACTPSAGRAHFNLSGGPHTGYFRSGHAHSQIMAMRELKLPMLKHSRATSMKNSITCALCFFLAGWGQDQSFSGPASPPRLRPSQTPHSSSLLLSFSKPTSLWISPRPRVSGPCVAEPAHASEV